MNKIEQIKNKIKEIENLMNSFSVDEVNEHKNQKISYIDDAFHNYSDYNTSIYYYQQFDYYINNQEYCDNMLQCVYGSFASFAQNYDDAYTCLCGVGALGEYHSNLEQLEEDKHNIIALLYLHNLLEFENELISHDNEEGFEIMLANIDNDKAYTFEELEEFEHCETFEAIAFSLDF